MDTEPIVYRGRTFAQIWIRISISLVRLMDWIQRQFTSYDFFMNQFPPSPWVYQYGRFEFFAKICGDIRSSRCTRVVDTGGKWQKIFKLKNFNYLVWTPLGSRVNIYINFCLQVHFKMSAAWYCSHYLPPVSLIPVAICHRRHWHRWQICRR